MPFKLSFALFQFTSLYLGNLELSYPVTFWGLTIGCLRTLLSEHGSWMLISSFKWPLVNIEILRNLVITSRTRSSKWTIKAISKDFNSDKITWICLYWIKSKVLHGNIWTIHRLIRKKLKYRKLNLHVTESKVLYNIILKLIDEKGTRGWRLYPCKTNTCIWILFCIQPKLVWTYFLMHQVCVLCQWDPEDQQIKFKSFCFWDAISLLAIDSTFVLLEGIKLLWTAWWKENWSFYGNREDIYIQGSSCCRQLENGFLLRFHIMGLSTQRCPKQFRSLSRFLRASVDYGLQRRPVKLWEEKFESMPTADSCGLDIIFADWDIRPDAFHGSAHYVENLRHLHNGFTKLFHSILLFLPLEILQGPF